MNILTGLAGLLLVGLLFALLGPLVFEVLFFEPRMYP